MAEKRDDSWVEYPLMDAAAKVASVMQMGGKAYVKYLCGKCGCGVLVTEPNMVPAQAVHEECGGTTEIVRCGVSVEWAFPRFRRVR